MSYVIDDALNELSQHIKKVLNVSDLPALEPANPKFGADFALPCFTLAKKLGKSPHDIATKVASGLQHEAVGQVQPVAGYVNIWLSDSLLAKAVMQASEMGDAFGKVHGEQKRVVIETNNPNPFKDLHIGHAYNSIVADTMANVLETAGAEVHRVSYHGDVGLHVGRSMWAILRYIDGDPKNLAKIQTAERAKFLSRMYAEGTKMHKENESARDQIEQYAKQSFVLDDPIFAQVYETCKQWSFEYLEGALLKIGSKPVEKRYMERDADELGRKVVEQHIGDIFQHSNDAIIFPGEKYGLHTRVFISARGTTLYEARDLGLIQLKEKDFHPDVSFIVTGGEQKEYFRVVLKAADLVLPEAKDKTVNIPTGLVKLTTGKMSSRTGDVVNIEWLFSALQSALSEFAESSPESAEATITGALRYTMLRARIGGDLIFDVNDAINLEGNTGPYLQYAFARGHSILAKADAPSKGVAADLTQDEHELAAKILAYPQAISKAATELSPHHICTFLYELTQQFNRFYEHNRIIGDSRQDVRIGLVQAYCQTLENGLRVLGIPAPQRL